MGSFDVPQLGADFSECIKLGVMHSPSGRFLTAEVFNSEINVSSTVLRRRQIWTVLIERGRPETIYLQSHLGRFLSADKDGRVSGAAIMPDVDERFVLEFSPQATGEWAFRSEAHGYYLSGSDTQMSCFSKTPVWWAIRLTVHPQVHLRHLFRGRYLRMLPDASEFRADQAYPWGSETLFWIEQPPLASGVANGRPGTAAVGRVAVARLGRVALRTEVCGQEQYLTPDGSLSGEMDDTTLFTFELRPGKPRSFAFRDSNGAYLTTVGPGTTKIKPTALTPGKEELFLIERAALQVGVLAHNGKFASVKQGVEISANQQELDDTAVFQMEYIGGVGFNSTEAIAAAPCSLPQSPAGDIIPLLNNNINNHQSATNGMTTGVYCLVTGHWRLRSRSGKLWKMAPSSGVQNNADDGDKDSLFEVLTLTDEANTGRGQVVLRSNAAKGNEGQSLAARKLGAVSTSGRPVSDSEQPASTDVFRILLINRPSCALLSQLTGGFISRGKHTGMDCSGMNYERFELWQTQNNSYQLFAKNQNSSYSIWTACPDGLIHLKPTTTIPDECGSDCPDPGTEFLFHYLGNGRVLCRCVDDTVSTGLCLVKAEIKGEVKWESTADIMVNHIWEI